MNDESNKIKKDENAEDVFCCRCGKKLRGEKSKKLKYGPRCYMLYKKEHDANIRLFNSTDGVDDK